MFDQIEMKLEKPIKINVQITLQALTLMAGKNGVGKSFTNKVMWATNFFQAMMIQKAITKGEVIQGATDTEVLQKVFDGTFDDQDFHGSIGLTGKGQELRFDINQGKIMNLRCNFEMTPVGMPTYLSSSVRSFTAIEQYLTIRNLMKVKVTSLESALSLDTFKLYDVFAYETLINKLPGFSKAIQRPEAVTLLEEAEIDVTKIESTNDGIYAFAKDGTKHKATNLGAGEQAILVLLLTTL